MKAILTTLAFCAASVASAQNITLIDVPAGSFIMGGTGEGYNADEAPMHKVNISAFKMSATEITNAQYELFDPSHKALRGKDNVSRGDNEAVVNVSYRDAVAYCAWLSRKEGKTYRLPTEAEWEYACRANTVTPYFTGDTLPADMLRNQVIARDYKAVNLEVGKTAPNAFGLYDMHGNVEEWCADWYGKYSADEQTNPQGPMRGEFRVTRGGSHHTPVEFLRSGNRMAMLPDDRQSLTGFRVVQGDFPKEVLPADKKPAFFAEPKPFVIPPTDGITPFYKHNHQPALTWCDNGDLLVIWFSTDHENGREMVVLTSRFHPSTGTWDEARHFFSVPDRNVTGASLLNDGNGTIFHLNGMEAAGDWQNLAMVMRTSRDDGRTWSSPRIIAPEHTKRHQVIAGTALTREGWMLQCCDAGPGSHDGAALHISRDGGNTWRDEWDGAPLPDFSRDTVGTTIAGIHAGIVQLADGTLMTLARGNSIVNAEGKKRMPMSLSYDMGKTWHYQPSPFPPIDGGQRIVLMRLREGAILLVSFTNHPDRTPVPERGMTFTDANGKTFTGYGLYAALSFDEGKTWPVRRLLTDGTPRHLSGGAWTGAFDMDATHAEPSGYLAGTQSPDGTIHIVSSAIHYQFNLRFLTND